MTTIIRDVYKLISNYYLLFQLCKNLESQFFLFTLCVNNIFFFYKRLRTKLYNIIYIIADVYYTHIRSKTVKQVGLRMYYSL